jgi:hypothetical protein
MPVTTGSSGSGTGTASGRNMSPLAVMTSRGSQGFGDSDEQNDNGTNTTAIAADTVCTQHTFAYLIDLRSVELIVSRRCR